MSTSVTWCLNSHPSRNFFSCYISWLGCIFKSSLCSNQFLNECNQALSPFAKGHQLTQVCFLSVPFKSSTSPPYLKLYILSSKYNFRSIKRRSWIKIGKLDCHSFIRAGEYCCWYLEQAQNWLLTFSFPLLNAQIETWYAECPISTKTTFRGFSSRAGRSCL